MSISPSEYGFRLGYDAQQIDRIVIRIAQYFLNQDMQVIFGHDWQNDGVMRAVANFAGKVALHPTAVSQRYHEFPPSIDADEELPRMLNVVPAPRDTVSRAAFAAERNLDGVLKVAPVDELVPILRKQFNDPEASVREDTNKTQAHKMKVLSHCTTLLLNPGCRICLGGFTDEHQETRSDEIEDAKLALAYGKPLYLMGGFGGAVRNFGEDQKRIRNSYWTSHNGLTAGDKSELFDTIDIEHAMRLISRGVESLRNLQH